MVLEKSKVVVLVVVAETMALGVVKGTGGSRLVGTGVVTGMGTEAMELVSNSSSQGTIPATKDWELGKCLGWVISSVGLVAERAWSGDVLEENKVLKR